MKSIIASVVAVTGLMVGGVASAVDLPAVGKAECGACHSVDRKVVGPAFKDVAAKYKDDKDAVAKISASVAKGGSFGWHYGSMPPRGLGASDADIATMAKFIAGLRNNGRPGEEVSVAKK